MVVLSLLLQFLLVGFGNRQSYQGRWSPYVAMLVWSTNLLADWIATVALSALLKAKKNDLKSELVVFWAPFLLLHLDGPHTISAYSLADNEIWLRYLFGLVIQVGVAIYVYIQFRTNSTLTYIAIPIFISGINKYAERVWILRAASQKQFSNSVFSSPKSATTKSNGWASSHLPQTLDDYLKHKKVIEGGKSVHKAFYLFKMFIPLFSDLRLRIFRKLSNNLLSPFNSAEDAFTLVHIELGFLYDVLYTKATIMQSTVGVILRSICLLSTFAALVAFSITVGKSGYPREDISLTYVLLGGAILLDIFSAISHALSSWTILSLTSPSKLVSKFACQRIVSWLVLRNTKKKERVSMAQYNLIDYCLKVKTSNCIRILSALDAEDIVEKFWRTTWFQVNGDLKKFICSHFQKKFKRYQNSDDENVFNHDLLLDILKERGDHVLQSHGLKKEFKWSINDVEFSHSILAWHIATFILFYDDHNRYSGGVLGSYCQISKLLSDYMMYLLLVRPLMLPKGIGRVRIKDTREEVIRYFGDKSSSTSNNDAASALLPSGNEFPLLSTQSKSVLRDGCKLASKLKGLVGELLWDLEEKWEVIANVWMEMLAFAAGKCGWREHAIQLRSGGELLTHVELLMAHLGLTEHIRSVQPTDDDHSLQSSANNQVQPSSEKPPFGHSLMWDWDQLSHLAYYTTRKRDIYNKLITDSPYSVNYTHISDRTLVE